jgi:hypothetical protein
MIAYCGRPRSASIWVALATAIITQTGSPTHATPLSAHGALDSR